MRIRFPLIRASFQLAVRTIIYQALGARQGLFETGHSGDVKNVFRWLEHTGELELEIEAPTEAAVFVDALAAFVELVGGSGIGAVKRTVELDADDGALLLADWLNELVYLLEVERFVPERISALELDRGKLRATIRGHEGDPPQLVKAVTLHRLDLREDEGTWHARVVLDV
jgi:SHS2 domain-containing protein